MCAVILTILCNTNISSPKCWSGNDIFLLIPYYWPHKTVLYTFHPSTSSLCFRFAACKQYIYLHNQIFLYNNLNTSSTLLVAGFSISVAGYWFKWKQMLKGKSTGNNLLIFVHNCSYLHTWRCFSKTHRTAKCNDLATLRVVCKRGVVIMFSFK